MGPQVSTSKGVVEGVSAGGISSFKGVPYARPPIGDLRFKPAQPAMAWEGVLDGTQFSKAPFQTVNAMTPSALSEDCLYLNVWVPEGSGPFPIFFWIYGGGDVEGDAGYDVYDGSALASEGVMVVSINYRVSTLGFLKVDHLLGPDYKGAENNGCGDIVAALRWVKDEIAHFGGDPDRVTIAGESAGGKNVTTLIAMDDAKGLFNQAIIESSTGECVFTPAEAEIRANKVFGELGISKDNANDLLTVDPAKLIAAEHVLNTPGVVTFEIRSVVDGDILKRSGLEALREGLGKDIRILIGCNHDEYDIFLKTHPLNKELGPEQMSYVQNPQLAKEINQRYRDYMPNATDEDRRFRTIVAEEWWIPSIRYAEAQAGAGGQVWMFRFNFVPTDGPAKLRACHTMELPFVFNTTGTGYWRDFVGPTPGATDLAAAMSKAWANFVKGESPGGGLLPEWPQYDSEDRLTMCFDVTNELVSDPDSAERQLWDGIQ